ncbi:MAG: imidazole glycerol phosphate synthase subunit HisF [Candidatus Peribacteraceae bacterium]|nr:imidazole glycerol phosphate synthase subunit HisF [Candidatus Peribacteraceae bacterium]MDD5074952.1 imidazole glycerol phosphate synthase subunit HisF [Candidatus Peribacteraceae bacterium]
MQIIPAIDVLNGKVVRLRQGDFARITEYGDDPLALVKAYRNSGALRVHLVDLSAAKSGRFSESLPALVRALSRETEVQAGGGIRSLKDMQMLLDAGASAVVIGTLLFREPAVVRSAVLLFGERSIIAALDVEDGKVKINGWRRSSGASLLRAVRLARECGILRILVTDICRDGMENGPNDALYAALMKQFPDMEIIASGGIRNLQDIRTLRESGVQSVVVGKALLENPSLLMSFIDARRGLLSSNVSRIERYDGLAIRVIPCLDVMRGRVVKGTCFADLRDAGDPVELAKRYAEEGADELVFLDITATSDGRKTVLDLVSKVADAVNIPFTIGGGVRSADDAHALLGAGADKVAVNSAAVGNPSLLNDIAKELGRANTVCAIDARRKGGGWTVLTRGGRDDACMDAVVWAEEAVARGAGELLVTSFDRDGTGRGFDTDLLACIKEKVFVPVIASGGGGELRSFVDAVRFGRADAVLAASVFHFDRFSVRDVKNSLRTSSFPVRL